MENEKRKNTIIGIISAVALVIILIIIGIANMISKKDKTGGLDNPENVVINTNTSSLVSAGFPQNLYSDFSQNFYDAMLAIDPTCNKQADAKNIEVDDNTYNFSIVRCNTTYDVELTNTNNKNYVFVISKSGESLVTYNSEVKGKAYLATNQISKFLPMNLKTADGDNFTLVKRNSSSETELEVTINSCGNQDKKNKAIESAKGAIELSGFNPEEFTFVTPDYCDAEW